MSSSTVDLREAIDPKQAQFRRRLAGFAFLLVAVLALYVVMQPVDLGVNKLNFLTTVVWCMALVIGGAIGVKTWEQVTALKASLGGK